MYPNIRVLLGIGCTLPVSFAEAEILLLSHVSETECLNSGWQDFALMHLHHDFEIHVDKICAIFVTKHQRRIFQGCSFYE